MRRNKVLRMNNAKNLGIRPLNEHDPIVIAAAFAQMGWNKPEAQYRQYLSEQAAGHPNVLRCDC